MAINNSEFALHMKDSKGNPAVVLPGGEIPAWAVGQVTNPYALGEETDSVDEDADEDADDSEGIDDGDDDDDGDDLDGEDADDDAPPPLNGKGSSAKAWAAYAGKKGFEVEGLSRDEIVDALRAEGIRVE